MNTSLAVRYRPKTLDQVIGQDTSVKVIKRLAKEDKLRNRGIFIYGLTGSGKTSLARIITHYANCENLNLETCLPCGVCEYCKAVEAGSYPGMEELNFSETRGIDTIRGIIESLSFVSTHKTKIIVLDELHNMTEAAANAFLKILEEPPEGTLFILLTSKPQAVLPTLINRCTQISVSKVSTDILANHLLAVATKEGVELPAYTYSYIAKSSSGIVRQALTSLEVAIALTKEDPTVDLSNHHFLEEKLEAGNPATNPAGIAGYLIGGIYLGSIGQALLRLQKALQSPAFNGKFFAERLFEYHTQTFYCLIDPTRQQKALFNDFYNDWYETLIQQVKKKSTLNVTVASCEVLFDLLVELMDRASKYELDANKLFTAYTVKMARAVKDRSETAYTSKSPFHKKHAPELCNDPT